MDGATFGSETPYRIPHRPPPGSGASAALGGDQAGVVVRKHFLPKRNQPYFYAFVHVPKAGGSYFKALLADVVSKNSQRLGKDPHAIVGENKWVTWPLVDLTEAAFQNTMWHYVHKHPPSQFSGAGMVESYRLGHRAIGKGALAMGVCEHVDAPCAYFTVLRDPVERYFSHYTYLCLEGSEGQTGWKPEWIAQGRCPADPVEFFDRVGGWVQLLAPGAEPSSRCAVDAAKENLVAPCMRYLVLENLEHGLEQLRRTMPDLAQMGQNIPGELSDRKNDSSGKLDAAGQARLTGYRADKAMMDKLRALLAPEIEVYQHAVANYDAQWSRPFDTC